MKKRFRLVLIGFACVIMLLLVVQLFVWIFLPGMIKKQIVNSVTQASHGLYTLSIDEVTANIFQLSIEIHHAQFNFQNHDTSFINSYPHLLWKGTIDQAEISGFNVIQFLLNKRIEVKELFVSGTAIDMIRPSRLAKNDSVALSSNSTKKFPSVTIGSLITRNISFRILNLLHDTLPSFQAKDVEVTMKGVKIDSSVIFSQHKLFDAEEAMATVKKIEYITPDSLFRLTIPKIQFSYRENNVSIDSLQFAPRVDRGEFLKKIPVEQDYLTIRVTKIQLENTDIKRLLEAKELLADKMIVDSILVYSYRDKNISDNKKVKPMPQELLYKCPFLLRIDSFILKNSKAVYEERSCDATEAGKVWFNEINGVITHITNDSIHSKGDTMKISATALLMGEGKISATFLFPLFDHSLRFYSHGSLALMSFKSLNPMLETNAGVSVRNGMIKHLEYTMNADRVKSTGEVEMVYDSLEIDKISKDDKSGSSVANQVVSFLAHLIIKKNSSTAESKSVSQPLEWRRDPSRSIFNYTWKTLWSGVKKSIGIPSNKNTTIGETTCP